MTIKNGGQKKKRSKIGTNRKSASMGKGEEKGGQKTHTWQGRNRKGASRTTGARKGEDKEGEDASRGCRWGMGTVQKTGRGKGPALKKGKILVKRTREGGGSKAKAIKDRTDRLTKPKGQKVGSGVWEKTNKAKTQKRGGGRKESILRKSLQKTDAQKKRRDGAHISAGAPSTKQIRKGKTQKKWRSEGDSTECAENLNKNGGTGDAGLICESITKGKRGKNSGKRCQRAPKTTQKEKTRTQTAKEEKKPRSSRGVVDAKEKKEKWKNPLRRTTEKGKQIFGKPKTVALVEKDRGQRSDHGLIATGKQNMGGVGGRHRPTKKKIYQKKRTS